MRAKLFLLCIGIASICLAAVLSPPFWGQWGGNAQHTGNVAVAGQTGTRILADIVYDPFTQKEEQGPYATGDLLVHYQTPLIAGSDVFMECKTGQFSNIKNWQVQTWCEQKFTWVNGVLTLVWTHISDWKPVPFSPDADGPGWEPVYHGALTRQAMWVPGFGGAVWKLSRDDGSVLAHVTPFGATLDPNTYTVGPLSADGAGNIYYNVMQLDGSAKDPWLVDVPQSWLVKVTAAGVATAVPWASLVPGTPAATDQCTFRYDIANLPWPVLDANGNPAPVPTITCGSQRPALNTAPAIAPDGTIYDVSRASLNDYWGYLVAINPNLTPRWVASMRGKFNDGCGTSTLPPNGQPGGCRAGSPTGVSPPDGMPGSGRVLDDNTAAPLIAPDGSIYYGAYTRYNYAQGHLMHWSSTGQYLNGFEFGWDTTPAIFPFTAANGASTWAVITKENHYGDVGSYCNDNVICPPDRNATNPGYSEQYFLTSLTPDLKVNWRWRNTNTLSCSRNKDGTLSCISDHPVGFEWCVNAPAVDGLGTNFVNSEDGNLYVIDRNGNFVSRTFTNLAVGAAYTPLSIGPDGRIYTQNNGHLFVVGN
ncbi:MAG TPA: hypothetical protein VI356_23155 [Myxococcales bacterium]